MLFHAVQAFLFSKKHHKRTNGNNRAKNPQKGIIFFIYAVTGIICFSAPEIGIIYSFLDMNGNVDDVINYIINQIEAMYSR